METASLAATRFQNGKLAEARIFTQPMSAKDTGQLSKKSVFSADARPRVPPGRSWKRSQRLSRPFLEKNMTIENGDGVICVTAAASATRPAAP